MSAVQDIRNQAGVAMITVLLVGMVLTVVTSVAAFSTIKELQASTDDRKSAEALAYAEAGIDRFLRFIKVENVTWHELIRAGCEDPAGLSVPAGVVGDGTFEATLKVYEPNPPSGNSADRTVPGACNYRATAPNDPTGQHFMITSKGEHSTANRVVEQVVKIGPLGLPIGIYAQAIEAGGTPNMSGISMITEGSIRGREKLQFSGQDPYYFIQDVFDGVTGRSPTEHVPAAAHALLGIYLKQNGTSPEFPPAKNCTANGAGGQSLWDSDGSAGSGTVNGGCSGQVGNPNSSKLTPAIMDRIRPHKLTEQDHQAMRDAARTTGIYCQIGTTTSCTMRGQPMGGMPATWQDSNIAPLFAAGVNNFVAYFDFVGGDTLSNSIKWHANVWGCNATNPDLHRSAVIVVRRGGLEFQGAQVNGAFIMDGELKYSGNPTLNGPIISQSGFRITGNANFSLDTCWVKNMPGPFLTTTPTTWAEVDR